MKKRNWVIGLGLVMGLAMSALTVSAQTYSYGMVYTVKGYPDKVNELYEAIKAHTEWRSEQGDPWHWNVLRVVVGQELGAYKIVSFGHQLSDLDDYQDFLAKGRVHWLDNVMPYVSEITNVIVQVHEDLSRWPDGTPVNYVTLWQHKIKPGKTWRWMEACRMYYKVLSEADHPVVYTVETVLNGTNGDYATLAFASSTLEGAAMPGPDVWDLMVNTYGGIVAGEINNMGDEAVECRSTLILKNLHELGVHPEE